MRTKLKEIPLSEVLPLRRPEVIITMSIGQWDAYLESAYDYGFILIELDEWERPVRAFRKFDLG
jgi:hypothetical protein